MLKYFLFFGGFWFISVFIRDGRLEILINVGFSIFISFP